jgi:hypothetical protein
MLPWVGAALEGAVQCFIPLVRVERISSGVNDRCPAEQSRAPVGLQRLIGIDADVQEVTSCWLVTIFQAVHPRTALDG